MASLPTYWIGSPDEAMFAGPKSISQVTPNNPFYSYFQQLVQQYPSAARADTSANGYIDVNISQDSLGQGDLTGLNSSGQLEIPMQVLLSSQDWARTGVMNAVDTTGNGLAPNAAPYTDPNQFVQSAQVSANAQAQDVAEATAYAANPANFKGGMSFLDSLGFIFGNDFINILPFALGGPLGGALSVASSAYAGKNSPENNELNSGQVSLTDLGIGVGEGVLGGALGGSGLLSSLTSGLNLPSLSDITNWLGSESGISLGDTASNALTQGAIGAGKGAITSGGDPKSSLLGGLTSGVGSGLSAAGNYVYNHLPSLGSIFNMSDETDTSGGGSGIDLSNGPNTDSVLYTGGGNNSFVPPGDSSGSVDYFAGGGGDTSGSSSGGSSGGSSSGGSGAGSLLGSLANSFLSPALLGAGANALGSYFASANQAAAADKSSAAQLAMFGQTQSNLLPFIQAGQGAAGALAVGTGLNTSNPFNSPLLKAPTMDQATLEQTPGYQFNKAQGLEATQNSFAAQGLGSSGAAMKGAANYAVGLADSTYQNQYNNAVTNQTNQFNRLMALSNQGQSSAANQGTLGTQVASNISSNAIGAANAGSAAITSAAGNASNALTLNSYLSLLAGQQNSPSGTA